MTGMSLSSGIGSRSNRGGVFSARGVGLQHLRVEEARESGDEDVEHDADDDLVDEVLDRERGEHRRDEHARDHGREQSGEGRARQGGDDRRA